MIPMNKTMLSPSLIIGLVLAYLAVLFFIAFYVEKRQASGINLAGGPLIYVLALATYCTAWTFYGNVGLAATNGYLFLAIYIGPTLSYLFLWEVMKRLIRIKNEYNLSSIADFISARHDKSALVAALATIIALVGILPYLALQLKAIFSSYSFITTGSNALVSRGYLDLVILVAIIFFVIVFGFRDLKQSQKHPGLLMVVAIQSIVKLAVLFAVGVFVTYFIHDGFADILMHAGSAKFLSVAGQLRAPDFSTWISYLILAMSAIFFLPRQFHLGVVENSDERHLRTALWLLPLYFFLITIFVYPIAIGGVLKGHDARLADIFVLLLPLESGNAWLSVLVFLGGLSATFSMLMIAALAITSMVSNHLVLPVFEKISAFNFLRRHLLLLRWALVVLLMFLAYWFELKLGSSYMLVQMGMISFAAILQFAPSVICGLFWEKGSKAGAVLGLSSGFLLWAYTALLPAFIKSGWLAHSILTEGPWGIGYLRPENLFGVSGLDPLAVTVLFSMLFNIGFYVAGSIFFGQSETERQLAMNMVNISNKILIPREENSGSAKIVIADKLKVISSIFNKYLHSAKAKQAVIQCVSQAGLEKSKEITLDDLIRLNSEAEKILASYIGMAHASNAMAKESLFNKKEAEGLSLMYSKMAKNVKLTPSEISQKINYFLEKEALMKRQSNELEVAVKERTKELEEKNRQLEKFYKISIDRELKMVELKKKLRSMEL